MAPPFLAYYAVSTNNTSLLNETVRQCGLYRQIMQSNTTAAYYGLWEHIVGPQSADPGLWSTGNGWAAFGMARVLATLSKWKVTKGYTQQIALMKGYIKEILDGAIAVTTVPGVRVSHLSSSRSPLTYSLTPFKPHIPPPPAQLTSLTRPSLASSTTTSTTAPGSAKRRAQAYSPQQPTAWRF